MENIIHTEKEEDNTEGSICSKYKNDCILVERQTTSCDLKQEIQAERNKTEKTDRKTR